MLSSLLRRFLLTMLLISLLPLPVCVVLKAADDQSLSSATIERLKQTIIPIYLERLGFTDRKVAGEGEGHANGVPVYVLTFADGEDVTSQTSLFFAADGRLVYLSRYTPWTPTQNQLHFPKYSLEQATAIAEDFCAKVLPEAKGHLGKPQAKLDYRHDAWITFPRLHNGTQVFGDSLTVQVDLNSGELNSFSHWRQSLPQEEIQPKPAKLDAQSAQQALREALKLELRYEQWLDYPTGRSGVHLVYGWKNSVGQIAIDANTGELIQPYRSVSPNPGEDLHPTRYSYGPSYRLGEEELAQHSSETPMLSSNQAIELLSALPGLHLQNMELAEEAYSWEGDVVGLWLRFVDKNPTESTMAAWCVVVLNNESHELISMNRSSPAYDPLAPHKSDAELLELAETFARTASPSFGPELTLRPDDPLHSVEGRKSFTFSPLIDGLPYINDNITMTWDMASGMLLSFYCYQSGERDFPAAAKIVDAEAALDALLERYPLGLYYYSPDYFYYHTEGDPPAPEPRLVYTSASLSNATVDAFSGEVLYPNNADEEGETAPTYADLADHPYREELLFTAAFLMLPSSEQFRPEESIVQGDWICWLQTLDPWVSSFPTTERDAYFAQLGRAIDAAEIAPEKDLTCLEGVTYLLRRLGYRHYSNLRGAYLNPHNLDDREAAYAALAKGLGLVDAKTFQPEAPLSRADALLMLHRYLSR